MTDQPTAPQPWDTLPDDPDAIPFPIVVGWDQHGKHTGTIRSQREMTHVVSKYATPDWWMPWPTFAPDPMTVNQWHDMSLLPNDHPEWVYIEFEDGSVDRELWTRREYDAEHGRKRWRSEAAMLAHVGGTVEGES